LNILGSFVSELGIIVRTDRQTKLKEKLKLKIKIKNKNNKNFTKI